MCASLLLWTYRPTCRLCVSVLVSREKERQSKIERRICMFLSFYRTHFDFLCLCLTTFLSIFHALLQCVAVCCSVLQCVAVCCSVLQRFAMCCSVLQRGKKSTHKSTCAYASHTATHRNALQHTATHCNTLQYTATHCSTLQHTATHGTTRQHTTHHTHLHTHTCTHAQTPM